MAATTQDRKKRRTEKAGDTTAFSSPQALVERARLLEKGIREDKKNLNDLLPLLALAKDTQPGVLHAAIHALQRLFSLFLSRGDILPKATKDTEANANMVVSNWLRQQMDLFRDLLFPLLTHAEPGLQIAAVDIVLTLYKDQQANPAAFPAPRILRRLVESIIRLETAGDAARSHFAQHYVAQYDDIRFYFYTYISDAANAQVGTATGNLGPKVAARRGDLHFDSLIAVEASLLLLEGIRELPSSSDDLVRFWSLPMPTGNQANAGPSRAPAVATLAGHRKAFGDAWLAVLRLPLEEAQYKRILLLLHRRVIPHMSRPVMLMDFLTDSYNAGGPISLLALNGLFTLMQDHNLDYPLFYPKLYALFDRNLLHVKYRARFFRLADLFLSSTHLPAYLVAAFIKRLSRLSLSAPPAAIVIAIPFIYNLLKRHPNCMTLIHRPPPALASTDSEDEDTEAAATPAPADAIIVDAYDMEETDPSKANALKSSLWELDALRHHFYPHTASLAKILSEKFTKPSYSLEDFLDHTYATLFDTESARINKPRKTTAVAAYAAGEATLFPVESVDEEEDATSAPRELPVDFCI